MADMNTKAAWAAPSLTVYGTVAALTQAKGFGFVDAVIFIGGPDQGIDVSIDPGNGGADIYGWTGSSYHQIF